MHTGLIYGYPRPDGGFYYVGQTRVDGFKRRHREHCTRDDVPFDRFMRVNGEIKPVVLKFVVCNSLKQLSNLLDDAEEDAMIKHKTLRLKFPEYQGWNFMTPRGVDYNVLARIGGLASNQNPENRNRLKRLSTFESRSKGGKIGGAANVETGQSLALGLSQGKKNLESGHWDRIKVLGYEGAAERAKIQGLKNVESGHLASLNQGKKNAGKPGYMASIGKLSAHVQRHVKRNIINPSCSLCGLRDSHGKEAS